MPGLVHRLLLLAAALAPAAAWADPDYIACGGSYYDNWFGTLGGGEDNTCGSYASSCRNPPGDADDRVLRLRAPQRAWMQINVRWGADEKMGVFVQRGSACSNTIACSGEYWGTGAWTRGWEADAGVDYYVAVEEFDWDAWTIDQDYWLDLSYVGCCPDADGDGTYAFNAGVCSQMPNHLRDCNDSDRNNSPGGTETCDGRDNDCDNQIDEGLSFSTYYADADGDGYGNPAAAVSACARPAGYVSNNTDCNDTTALAYPGGTEVCDGLDNNCAGGVDEGVQTTYFRDADGDTWGDANNPTRACALPAGHATRSGDCNDNEPRMNPGRSEECDGLDNDCRGGVDDGVGTMWYRDFDGDGRGNASVSVRSCTAPAGYVTASDDCDDSDPQRSPALAEWCDNKDNDCDNAVDDGVGTMWYLDGDRDGRGDPASAVQACLNPGGYIATGGDCDDTDAERSPRLSEWCDGKDNDCDNVVDDGVGAMWFVDADGDGWGREDQLTQACALPAGHASRGGDCDDAAPDRFPGNPEICDLVDNDCDQTVDEDAVDAPRWYRDNDRDRYGNPALSVVRCDRGGSAWIGNDLDCDDTNPAIRPGGVELPYDGIDQDCDGADWCDVDGDGFDALIADCGGADCADGDPAIRPGAPEVQNGADDDCDGWIDEGTAVADDDGDGWTEDAGDCDDADPLVNPGAPEQCTGTDTDCDGAVDEGTDCADDDGDGFSEDEGDCHDEDPAIGPHAAEIPGNGVDDDCDGLVDGGGFDADRDGVSVEGGDCDDRDPTVRPGAREVADGKDNDCDGLIDEGTAAYDDDGDGWTEQEGDCDDTDPDISPDAVEVVNGRDDDCDGLTDDGGPGADDDGDGLSEVQGDCDDGDPSVRPGAAEIENGEDDDCDGEIDEGLADLDEDGFRAEDGDCDDLDGWVHPGAAELCDGVDNDCDERIDEGCVGGSPDTDGETDTLPPGEVRCACQSGPRPAAWLPLLPLLAVAARRRR